MDPNLDFSEEEIQQQLALLGYRNIPRHRLQEFKRDLDELIQQGRWKDLTSPDQRDATTSEPGSSRPSPPAFTKVKVSRCYSQSPAEGFFLHPGPVDQDRQALTTCPNRDYVPRQGCVDSYAQHSVAPRLRPPPHGPSRLQAEPDPEDTELPSFTDSHASTLDTTGRRFIKRKVLRKHKGQSLVCDESVYSEESDVASCLEERMEELDLTASARHDEDEYGDETGESDAQSSENDAVSLSAFESYLRGVIRAQNGDVRPKPKSFIRPVPPQQTVKRADPVARYHQYKQIWDMCKIPGEADRRSLRQEIRERLAYQPPPPKPRRVYTPNTYVVPTEKKRSALRWEIRNALASGLLPHTFCYQL